ncbi:hypothetical protein NC652_001462 [Populus alba x Populus x berolinensis]|nr:hypothetical protein NC652_001462 [Populus alba x Populus x berolinensis]
MAESAVTFLLEKLAPLFENELQSLRGGGEEIVYVRGELERIRAFLRVADTLEESDEEVKVWVKQIRDVAHETEDILDEFTILLAHDHASGLYGLIHKLSCCIRNMKARYRIASQIKAINSRIRNISDGHRRLRQKFCVAEQGSSSTSTGWQDRREDALLLDMTDVVGIEKRKSKLVDWLVHGRSGREVVSLAGMGGLGKTTLAKQVYDDAEVKKHFSVHAWITVSRSYKMEELLKDIVQQLFAAERKPVPKTKDQNATWPDKIRRLSIHYTVRNVQLNRCVSQLRSLFMFGVVEKSPLRTLFPNGFRLLHVLDLQGAPIKKFPVQVINLYYLRYLSLKETKVSRVPSYIGQLQHLETLDLKHTYVTELPDEILKLQRLRHLLVYRYEYESYAHFHSKNGFKALEKIGVGGFKKLKLLGIDKFDELRCVEVEVGALPRVEKLSIQRCKLLEKAPLGIEHLTKLKVLEFFDMPRELIQTLRSDEQGGDYWRVAHIPEVYSTYWRDGGWEVYSLESFNDSSRPSPVIRSQELHPRWK